MPEFAVYRGQVLDNARTLASDLQERGHRIVSGGTDNHLMLLDFSERELTGKDAEAALGEANITVNKNAVPGDRRSPFVTSGIRIGTPALTTRGFAREEMLEVSRLIADALEGASDSRVLAEVRAQALALAGRFPVYAA